MLYNLIAILFLLGTLPTNAFERDNSTPRVVIDEAERSEKQCKAYLKEMGSTTFLENSALIEAKAGDRFGKIYVVDYAKGSCGDSWSRCGTGGCEIVVYRLNNGHITKLYSDHALWTDYKQNSDELDIHVHGSRCKNQSGPDSCITKLNLVTGKMRFLGKASQ